MKTQRAIQCLFSAVVPILFLCGPVWGQQVGQLFFDDFSDGNAQDGSPISWLWDAALADVAVVNGYLTVRPKVQKPFVPFPTIVPKDTNGDDGQKFTGDLAVTVQFTMTQPGDASAGIFVRSALPEDRQAYVGGIYGTNKLFLERDDGVSFYSKEVFGTCWIPGFNIGSEDLILQLSASDFLTPQGTKSSRIELRAWRPGEERPTQPQLSAVDSTYSDGFAGLYVDSGAYAPGLSDITVRWIEFVGEYPDSEPIVDFNGDGKVDISDLLRLIESWGQDDPMCDIAPHPFSDGIVDGQDLELLMSYWGQPVDDPTLKAHWALDEAEGNVAGDSVAENNGYSDGYLMGDPIWQPTGGQLDGALQLDGVDDFIITSPVLNPANGPFSVLAWIKGGAPGQAIISEPGGAHWLSLDLSTGHLMTELKSASRSGSFLLSETMINDGQWHRIALVWDGFYRTLYVDGVIVAEDTQDGLSSSGNGIYIGAGRDLEPGTFFSGLIDDVRIYNRAVSP